MSIEFIKMHGLGNDFVIIDNRRNNTKLTKEQIVLISHRNFGVGGNQVITLENSEKSDVFMRIYNPDGREVEACGNATRCVGLLMSEEKNKDLIKIETIAGILESQKTKDGLYSVNMGKPRLEWNQIPLSKELDTKSINPQELGIDKNIFSLISCVSMGNPHCVLFLKNNSREFLNNLNAEEIGKKIENHSLFPEKTNVEFVSILSKNEVNIKIWERGAGETLACGSGACAITVAGFRNNLLDKEVKINSQGGSLFIKIDTDDSVILTGLATKVFRGKLL